MGYTADVLKFIF